MWHHVVVDGEVEEEGITVEDLIIEDHHILTGQVYYVIKLISIYSKILINDSISLLKGRKFRGRKFHGI